MYAVSGMAIYTKRAYMCENTGSTKGHKDWYFGLRSGDWYESSPLEDFIRQKYPNELKHRWTSYAGTGINLYGQSISFGHGRPGGIRQISFWLKYWCPLKSDAEKKALYDLLVSDDQPAIRAKTLSIMDEVLDAPTQQ